MSGVRVRAGRIAEGTIAANVVRAGAVEPVFRDFTAEAIERIDHELALEELARLTLAERAEVAAWDAAWHHETHHGALRHGGIYACHMFLGPPPPEGWAAQAAERSRREVLAAAGVKPEMSYDELKREHHEAQWRKIAHEHRRDGCEGCRAGGCVSGGLSAATGTVTSHDGDRARPVGRADGGSDG